MPGTSADLQTLQAMLRLPPCCWQGDRSAPLPPLLLRQLDQADRAELRALLTEVVARLHRSDATRRPPAAPDRAPPS